MKWFSRIWRGKGRCSALTRARWKTKDLKFRSNELSDFIKEASTKYKFDLNSVVAVGYSNGANIAASVMLLDLLPVAGAAFFRPMVALIPDSLPDLKGVAIFVDSLNDSSFISATERRFSANSILQGLPQGASDHRPRLREDIDRHQRAA